MMSSKKYLKTENFIGTRLRQYRKYKNLNVLDFSKLLNISQGSLSGIENNKSKPSSDTLASMVLNTDINLAWLLTGDGEMIVSPIIRRPECACIEDFTLVPKYKVRLSGGPGNYVLEEDIEHHLAFKTTWLTKRCPENGCGLFTVTGDSMAPHITEGDIVLVDMTKNQPQDITDGKIYAYGEWDTVKIKRLMRQGPKIMAHSDNPLAVVPSMIEVDLAQFRLIGKIVWVGHEVK